MFLTTLY